MKHYGLNISEGSEVINLTAPTGAAFPVGPTNPPNTGELFFRTDSNGLYVYDGTNWLLISNAYTKAESDAKYAILANANTFTASQTIQATNAGFDLIDTVTNGQMAMRWFDNAGNIITDMRTNLDSNTSLAYFQIRSKDTTGATGGFLDLRPSGFVRIQNLVTTSNVTLEVSGDINVAATSNRNINFLTGGSGVVTVNGNKVADVGTANTFTQAQTFTSVRTFLEHTSPVLTFNETDQGTNLKKSEFIVDSGTLTYRAVDDALLTVTNTMLTITRDAQTLALTSTDITYNNKSIRTYAGRVDSVGNSLGLPTGWTVTKSGTGVYDITHSLGTTNVTLTATVESTSFDVSTSIQYLSSNAIRVRTSAGGLAADLNFAFMAQVL